MILTFINGSPRGTKSNTGMLMDHFIRGFLETPGNICRIEYIAKSRNNLQKLVRIFGESEYVIIGFPLYVDSMPGSVKEFFEALLPYIGRDGNPALGFAVQCGFPGTYQIRFVEKYCEKLARRIDCRYLGTILRSGCEGLDIQPRFLTDKGYYYFHTIGQEFGKGGDVFDRALLDKLAHPEHVTAEVLAQVIPFVNQELWDAQMKQNGTIDHSFDRPFA
jgi:hypothetical protein